MATRPGKSRKRKSCLVTAFDRFGKSRYNPSETVVQALPDEMKLKDGAVAELTGVVLPTCCSASFRTLKRAVKSVDPNVIVLCGQAPRRKNISLERFALNVRDYRIADNSGHTWSGEAIERGAPTALRTHAPLEELQKYLKRRGYPCEISNHAGTFVCNDVYFRALSEQNRNGWPRLIVFVHLPMPRTYARTVEDQRQSRRTTRRSAPSNGQAKELLKNAVLEIVKFCSDLA